MTLSGEGVTTAKIAGVSEVTDSYRGRAAVVYIAMHDPETLALLDEPEEFWRGFMSLLTLEADRGLGKVTLQCEHWSRITPNAVRYTDEEQRRLHPEVGTVGDRFFQWLPTVRDRGRWGNKDVQFGGGGGGGFSGGGHRQYV
jgi:hypothetical protein